MAWRNCQVLLQRGSASKILATSPLFSRGVTTFKTPHSSETAQEQQELTREETPIVVLDTKNGEAIFAGLRTMELLRTYANLTLVGQKALVDFSSNLLTSRLMRLALIRVPVNQVVKWTVYSHFCAGENVDEASRTLQRMWELGLRGILDYSCEDATDNKSCDENLKKFIQVIQQTNQLPQGSVSAVSNFSFGIM